MVTIREIQRAISQRHSERTEESPREAQRAGIQISEVESTIDPAAFAAERFARRPRCAASTSWECRHFMP
jgi:hypothetical protein